MITPGYLQRPDLSGRVFDEEGYFCSGDAVRLISADDPNQGLAFEGRIAEDFKLATGTWVRVGSVRSQLLSGARLLSDVVITGHDKPFVAALAWLNHTEAASLISTEIAPGADYVDHPELGEYLARVLAELNAEAGSSQRVERLLVLTEPPNLDANEITDKGYINQREVLERRKDFVEYLYVDPVRPGVITPNR